jgi:Glucose / Sorbosone dehydrogenase
MHKFLSASTRLVLICVFPLILSTISPADSVTDSIPPILPPQFTVDVKTVAKDMTAPNYAINAPGLRKFLFVVDQPGQLWRINLKSSSQTPTLFLDLSNLVIPLGIAKLGGYDERGFLGLAFHRDYAKNGLFYTFTSEPVSGPPDFTYPKVGADCPTKPDSLDPDHQNVVREWHVNDPMSASSRPDGASRVVLRFDWPNFNHDGGMLAFGPDKMLYISLGDGGGEDDQTCQIGVDGKPTIGHTQPQGNSQDPGNAYGKIFRIDPLGRTSGNGQYGVPSDNPFIGRPGFLPEIYTYGQRNTFRFNFDPRTGRIEGNDVGQNAIEEIDVIRAGGNYGWRVKEGTFLFDPAQFVLNGFDSDGHPVKDSPEWPPGLVDPVAEYAHSRKGIEQGHAGIGGFIYRGTAIEELRGLYVFGDYSQNFTDPIGRLLMIDDGRIYSLLNGTLSIFTLGIGRDAQGELYVTGNKTGKPSGKTGIVQRIVPSEDDE